MISEKTIDNAFKTVVSCFPKMIQSVLVNKYLNGDLIISFVPTKAITKRFEESLGRSNFWIDGLTLEEDDDKIAVLVSSSKYQKKKIDGLQILAHELMHAWQFISKPNWVSTSSKAFCDYDSEPIEAEAKQAEKDFLKKYTLKLKNRYNNKL